jgi:hypothetical protein
VLKNWREAVCWLHRHEGSVLVVGVVVARLVEPRHRNEGLAYSSARSLLSPARARWFEEESPVGHHRVFRLNAAGEAHHRRLVERRECVCPAPRGGESRAGA